MRVIVINRASDSSRKKTMKAWLPKAWEVSFLSDLGLDYDGASPKTLSGKFACSFEWRIDSENPWWRRPLKYGEIGCSLSHREAWKICAKSEKPMLVLEDDVEGAVDIDLKLEACRSQLEIIDPEWDLCYVGRVQLALDQEFICEGFVRPGYSHCTYGYLLTPGGAKVLLDGKIEQNMMPVDEYIPAFYIEHPRADVRSTISQKLNVLAVQPDLILQRAKNRAGSTTEATKYLD